MLFDDMDQLFAKIFGEIFCEESIAIPLKKRHDIRTKHVLKTSLRHETKPRFNKRLSKGRAPRGLSFSQK